MAASERSPQWLEVTFGKKNYKNCPENSNII
jgi:hypothetical protein